MSRSDRSDGPATKLVAGIIAAIAAVLIVAAICLGLYQQSKYVDEAAQRSAEYAEHARDKVSQACAAVAAPEKASCVEQAETEQQLAQADNERNEKDLVAQRTSALWTAIMGVAALIGMGLSAVGVWLVFDTFRATRRATEIANDNLEVVISTERAVLRPQDNSELGIPPNRPHLKCINLPLANAGNGNAVIREIRWTMQLDASWPTHFDDVINSPLLVEAKSEKEVAELSYLPPDDDRQYFVLGEIDYQTIANRIYTTHFCYRVAKLKHDPLILRIIDTVVELRRYPSHPQDT